MGLIKRTGPLGAVAILFALFGSSNAQVKPAVSGTVETYFNSSSATHGARQTFSWAELRARISENWSATWSGYDYGSFGGYDEAYVRYEANQSSVRAGRLRTSFGFSDWSELFYNGFNHRPLVREIPLVGNTGLDRDDSGAEISTNFGPWQIQAALLDTAINNLQVGPGSINHGTLTAQYGVGRFILDSEVLAETNGQQKVYGFGFRYTAPHWIVRGEAFEGSGPGDGSGAYIDASYRIPYKLRTEIVAREENARISGLSGESSISTLGVRHIFNRYLSANVNYAWGREPFFGPYSPGLNLCGWTGQLMFQVQF